jgi:septal ring factor EnvC (AmiA/AmiB activator)
VFDYSKQLTKVKQIIAADRALIEELQEIVSQQHGELQRRAETIGTVGQSLQSVNAQQLGDRAEIAELRGSAQAYVLEIARLQERASELHASAARSAAEQQAARSQNAALSSCVRYRAAACTYLYWFL